MAATDDAPHPLEAIAGTADERPATTSPLPPAPGDEAELDPDEHPFGLPGPPLSRHTPFYKGFWTGLGFLLALALALAIREAKSVIVLVLVSFFLAVGLNPVVEWFEGRGVRRRWAVLIVTLTVLALIALFIVSLVPVLRDQIQTIITNAPGWLDDLRRNHTVHDLDKKYDVISKATEKLQDPALAQQVFGSLFSVGLAVLSGLLNAFVVFVLTLYFLSALPQL